MLAGCILLAGAVFSGCGGSTSTASGPMPSASATPTSSPQPSPTPSNVPIGQITEFSIPTNNSGPRGIASGPDGGLWFTESNVDKIGQLTISGQFTEYPIPKHGQILPAMPGAISSAPVGGLWFTELGRDRIARLAGGGGFEEYPKLSPPQTQPQGIAPGSDGAIWFTTAGPYPSSAIGRVDILGHFTQYNLPANRFPGAITGGSDGALWFVETTGVGSGTYTTGIGRITTAGQFSETAGGGSLTPQGIAPGPDGALWFGDGAHIGRSTTAKQVTLFAIPSNPAASVSAIANGPDGALWFTDLSNKIGRITPTGQVTEYTIPTADSMPLGITAGSDGALWFTENAAGRIGRITTGLTPFRASSNRPRTQLHTQRH